VILDDLLHWVNPLVRGVSLQAWLLTWLLAWGVGAVVLFEARRRAPGHLSVRLFIGLHALAGLPAWGFLSLGLGSGWSAWGKQWSLALSLSHLALLSFLPVAVIAWVARYRRDAEGLGGHLAAATMITGLSLLSSVGTVLWLAPRA
jgi:hypothetical protein